MASDAHRFRVRVGEQLAARLPGFRFLKSKLTLEQRFGGNTHVIVLSGSSKYSPMVSLAYYVGVRFADVTALEKLLGLSPRAYHVGQYSMNASKMRGLTAAKADWDHDLRSGEETLVEQVEQSVHQVCTPYFARFTTVESARDALEGDDSWCIGGALAWRELLLIGALAHDRSRFDRWLATQPLHTQQKVEEFLTAHESALNAATA